jgi:predicted NBD/HSP70 family sugar kinase
MGDMSDRQDGNGSRRFDDHAICRCGNLGCLEAIAGGGAMATRNIRIARSTLDDRAGVIGAAVMVIEAVLAPDAVDQAIAAASA